MREPGDIAKALAAGAKVVMVGSMLAGTDEAPGKKKIRDGKVMKKLRGQASIGYMKDNGTSVTAHRIPEGVTTWIPAKGPVKNVIDEITGGLRSSMSYIGAGDLVEFYENTQFVTVSPAAQREARPHAKRTTGR